MQVQTRAIARLALLLALWSCGGQVVVDDDGQGGSGGTGVGGSGKGGSTASGGICLGAPTPVGAVRKNTCKATSDGTKCTNTCKDDANHAFEVACSDNSCRCVYDSKTICTCATQQSGQICDGPLAPCCPSPWIAD